MNRQTLPERMTAAEYLQLVVGNENRRLGLASKAKRATPEEDLHRECFKLVQLKTVRYPILSYLFHAPNGGARNKAEGGKLKAMGAKPGVPDFLLPRSRGPWRGLAIELKSLDGHLTHEQKIWLKGLESEGYLATVCRSLADFESLLQAFISGAELPSCVERGWEDVPVKNKMMG